MGRDMLEIVVDGRQNTCEDKEKRTQTKHQEKDKGKNLGGKKEYESEGRK